MNQKGFSPIFILLGIILIIGATTGAYYLGQTSVKPASITNTPSPLPLLTQPPNTPKLEASPIPTLQPTPTPISSEVKLEQAINNCQVQGLFYPHQGNPTFILKDGTILELAGKTQSEIKLMIDTIAQKCDYQVRSMIE